MRITNSSATLIDNIFVTEGLHLDDMSDHLPTMALLKQTKLLDKKPLEFESRNLTDKKVSEIKNNLMQVDWTITLQGKDSDENFNIFLCTVNKIMDKVSPLIMIRISSRCRFVELCMTRDLEISSREKKDLYKATLKNGAAQNARQKYIEYCNNYNKIKPAMRQTYYSNKAKDFAKDSEKLWSLINEVIKKNKHKGSIIPHITINGLKTSNPA